jgi:transcriptional regulator with XRE-family HTH domain
LLLKGKLGKHSSINNSPRRKINGQFETDDGYRLAQAASVWCLAASGVWFRLEDSMVIGEKLKTLREQKNMSQGDIEKRTGLLRCYISRVENGHTVPSVDTLEKMAQALEVPMYRLFTDEAHIKVPNIPTEVIPRRPTNSKEESVLRSFAKLFARMDEKSRGLLFHMASKMANRA